MELLFSLQDERQRYKKNGMILHLVESSGVEAYEKFKEILAEKNKALVEKIKEMENNLQLEGRVMYDI